MGKRFDIVIAGAGSAGCVLAERLSRDPRRRVLLLEAGGWDWNPLISIPVGARKLFEHGLYQWPDVSEPEAHLEGRRMAVVHGKVIGGGSSINYLAHTRGHPMDYDRWAASGAVGWSYADVLPAFKECESWEGGENVWRGGAGPVGARAAASSDPLFTAWLEAARSLGHPITEDYNGEHAEGFGTAQYSIGNGRRSSSAQAFLRPALRRPNLTVRTGATVTRVLFEGARAVGVAYAANGRERVARAGRTALCLGAINTPHILMLSGVGPAEHLQSVGVEPVADLPVGRNLEDHLGFYLHWNRRLPGEFHRSLRFDRMAASMLQAYFLRSGPSSTLPGAILAFVKSTPSAPQPDIELIIPMIAPDADIWFPLLKPAYRDGVLIRGQLLNQKSRGEILLRSTNPKDRPRIVYNSLSAADDLATLRACYRHMWALANAPALASFLGDPVLPASDLSKDSEIDAFIRRNAAQQYHPACTCKMGVDGESVVDPKLNVHGVEGLSIVDASVMPHLVSGNPNVPTMMMAVRAAQLWDER